MSGGTNTAPRLRMSVLGVVSVALFVALSARLYDLQIIAAPRYEAQAEANRIRTIQVPAPRGRILDRNGNILVDNRISVVVAVERNAFNNLPDDEAEAMLVRLSGELNLLGKMTTPESLRHAIFNDRFSRYAPVPVASDVPEEFKIFLEEHAEEFPAVSVERVAMRRYPFGPLAANVVGYTGKITEAELTALAGETTKPYMLSDDIGQSGVEAAYEPHLRGTPGQRRIEVDAEGDPVRVISERLPVPGSDVVLSLDINVQALAQQKLEQGLEAARGRAPRGDNATNNAPSGAVVVEDPNNGQVLAMASYPTYDPTPLADGISQSEWDYLNDPANHYPLYNWAIQGQYAAGSTFKLFTGYAALQSGLMAPDTVFYDQGSYRIPGCGSHPKCTRSNAGGAAHGRIAMSQALTVSSDTFFYNVGAQLWIHGDQYGGEEAMQQYIAPWGIGTATGIPLAHEKSGRLPTPQWLREWCTRVTCEAGADEWRAGDSVNLAVGQGSLTLTPLQLANGYSTFANGGRRYQPQIALRIQPPGDAAAVPVEPVVAGEVDLSAEIREPMLEGFVGVTQNGTAARAFSGFDHENWPIAGKTGTAQVDNKADTALFAAFGPAYAPQYAISVVMEESGFGGSNAAPVARALFDVLSGAVPISPAPLGGLPAADTGGLTEAGGAYD